MKFHKQGLSICLLEIKGKGTNEHVNFRPNILWDTLELDGNDVNMTLIKNKATNLSYNSIER